MLLEKLKLTAAIFVTLGAVAAASAAELLDGTDPNIPDLPHVSEDPSAGYDYPIVYVRTKRTDQRTLWANTERPTVNPPGAELMLLESDAKEEVLVPVEEHESITDPYVSYDGRSVLYAKYHDVSASGERTGGADIYRVEVATGKITRLTHQEQTPNTGAYDPAKERLPDAVYNLGPCPLPGGGIVFTSDRNAYRGVQDLDVALQLFVMDDDGSNVQEIGHINLGGAMHPVVLTDGRIMFSSAETQGIRIAEQWGLWAIRPDGTKWEPLFSAFVGNSSSLHFQTQLSNGDIVVEDYYPGATTQGFGTYIRFATDIPEGVPQFGPAYEQHERNTALARSRDVKNRYIRYRFAPYGMQIVTEFNTRNDVSPNNSRHDLGKVTHPSAAPGNHLLTVWTPPDRSNPRGDSLAFDSGIYLIKNGGPVKHPREMLLVKDDPKYREMWPRPLVPYKRIYGIDQPKQLPRLANDGSRFSSLPGGTPFGLIGTSSLYKRESYPDGVVPEGGVTATSAKPDDKVHIFTRELGGLFKGSNTANWNLQGADAGLYDNEDIWGIRIVALEPVTHARRYLHHYGHASGGAVSIPAAERLRILGEFPVRKFSSFNGKPKASGERSRIRENSDRHPNSHESGYEDGQPLDPDGNPDTSFLAKIPADVAWTFQTLDNNGMVLNMAQTWHQVRPGEARYDCGGCHAHSQKPTSFEETFAFRSDYQPFDLASQTPLFTTKQNDQSGKRWDADRRTGLRHVEKGVVNVEYFRDVAPVFQQSCVACHTKESDQPAAGLVLDDDTPTQIRHGVVVPRTYAILAADNGKEPYGPHIALATERDQQLYPGWRFTHQVSRYIRKMQSRRSLLAWKVLGRRTDGFHNDDFPSAERPGDPHTLMWKGEKLEPTRPNIAKADIDFRGSIMPPPEAVEAGKVAPLSDEDRLTIFRWIDLGCPIDFHYDPADPDKRGYGWQVDDQRPTLTLTRPQPGDNQPFSRILVGMYDYDTGLDMDSFTVTADFEIDGIAAGENLAAKFRPHAEGVWQWQLDKLVTSLPEGRLTVSVKDRQGNISRIERSFSVSLQSR